MLGVLLYLMEAIGARVREVLARKWQAIDWQGKRLWIYVNVYKGEFSSPKGHRQPTSVALDDCQLEFLARWRKRTKFADDNDYVFPNPKSRGRHNYPEGSRPVSYEVVCRALRRVCQKLDLPCKFTAHTIRHYNATTLVRNGVRVEVLQARLGHKDYRTTLPYYIHADPAADRQAAQIMGRVMGAPKQGNLWPESGTRLAHVGTESQNAGLSVVDT